MRGGSVALALVLAALMIAPFGTGLPELPVPGVLPGVASGLDRLTDIVGDKVPFASPDKVSDLLRQDLTIPADLQRIVDGNFQHHTFVVPALTTLTKTNEVVTITEDWDIFGTVNIIDSEVVFTGNFLIIVEGTGSLTISGASSVHDQDDDHFTGGTIRATGNLDIQGTASQKIPIRSTSIVSLARGNNDFATSIVKHVDFRDGRAALTSGNSAGLYEFNRFLNNDRGVAVLARSSTTGAGNPTVRNNVFVGNGLGVAIAGSPNVNVPSLAGKGQILNNEFQANQWGVRCSGAAHTGDNTKPFISGNNFRNHYAEAYGGTTGVSVTIGTTTTALIADSQCTVDGNFFATGETTWTGGNDMITNNQNNPIPNTAPSVAAADQPEVITTSVTKSSPTLTRPLIVDDGGVLTITGTMNANGFLWGSGTGGRLNIAGPLTVLNNGQLTIRNDNDMVDKLQIDGAGKRLTLFGLTGITTMHALQYRNSAALNDWTVSNFDHLLSQTNGLSRDTTPATPAVSGFTVTNGNEAFFGASMQISITDSTITNIKIQISRAQLGTTTFNNNVATLNDDPQPDAAGKVHGLGVINTYNADGNTLTGGNLGMVSVIGNVASSNNKYHAIDNAIQDVLGSMTSTSDEIDGGLFGVLTSQNSNTITSTMIAQQNFGVLSILDVSYSIASSTFAYNAYGVANAITPSIAVSNTNFRDNYQYALLGVPIALEVDVLSPTAITCSNCFFFRNDDKSWSDGGGQITVTEAAVANVAPSPPWLASVLIAGPAQTQVVSGTLAAPAIAREGGRLLVDNQMVDGGNRFAIGAKSGGNANGATGHVTIRDSLLDGVRFISVRSTQSTIEQNIFRTDSSRSTELIELTDVGMTIECNLFQAITLPVNWMRQRAGQDDLTFRRNLVDAESGGVDAGLADTDVQVSHILDNGYLNADPLTANFVGGLFDRFQPGHVEFRGNNLLAAEGLNDMNFGALSDNFPDAVDAADNWWNDANGPSVWRLNTDPSPDVLVNTRTGGSAIISLQDDDALQVVPQPGFTPWDTAANAIVPCVTFDVIPPNPTEIDLVSFTDNSIAPDGSGIVSRTWNFGDGSPAQTTPFSIITHDYLDGGPATVTLTVQTGSGQSASTSRSIAVSHVDPVANFVAAITNEITPVQFTDTSTHPNTPQDDPPTGWSYSWNFNGEGSSPLRDPSFDFADGGSKSITLTVTDDDGRTNSKTSTIVVPHVQPVADFTFSPASPTEVQVVQLTDASTHPNAPVDSITSRSWSCTDGFTSTATNPSHRFPDGNLWACTLTVGDNDGQSDAVTRSITVGHVAPLADFSFAPPTPTELQAVSFTDTSTHPNSPNDAPPGGWTYLWDFNGEGSSGARNPAFDFADGGSKAVKLTATDNDGQASFIIRNVPVSHVAPVADFTFSPNAPDPGVPVTFTSTSTHPNTPVDGIVSASWDFGDSTSGSGNSVLHTYAADGTYTVTLTVTDDDGQSSSKTRIVAVGNFPPVVDFVFSPNSPTDLQVVSFSGSATDADGSIVDTFYNFGDGTPEVHALNADHQFADDGVYSVTFTGVDNKGAESSIVKSVVVNNVAPTVGFTFAPFPPFEDESIQFTSTSVDADGALTSFAWGFGDSTSSILQNPAHTYPDPGTYTVSLMVMDDDGASAQASQQVIVCTRTADTPFGPVGVGLASGGGIGTTICTRLGI